MPFIFRFISLEADNLYHHCCCYYYYQIIILHSILHKPSQTIIGYSSNTISLKNTVWAFRPAPVWIGGSLRGWQLWSRDPVGKSLGPHWTYAHFQAEGQWFTMWTRTHQPLRVKWRQLSAGLPAPGPSPMRLPFLDFRHLLELPNPQPSLRGFLLSFCQKFSWAKFQTGRLRELPPKDSIF